jgi:hypothetical protein
VKAVGAVALALALVASAPATASIWIANETTRPALRVDSSGAAEVSWSANGVRQTQLVPRTGRVLPGGHLSGADVAKRAVVASLAAALVVRRTPDGSYWALQEWQVPGVPRALHLSHWRGAPTSLKLIRDGDRLSGRAVFGGRGVFGYSTTPAGQRLRMYVYLECFCLGDWKLMRGVPPHADGSFALLIQPQWQAPRYRALVVGPNRSGTLAPDAVALAR